MTYDAHETSVEGGRPIEVYEIVAGSTTYFYTSAEAEQTIASQAYTPVAGLRRGSTAEGPEKRGHDFQIEMPTSNPVAQLFVGVLPGFRVRLRVKRFHSADLPTPQVVQIFDGYVRGVSFSGNGKIAIFTARTVLSSRGRQIPRRTYKSACNHVHYDPATCKVDDTDPAFRASALDVASQVGTVLTVSSGLSGVYADGFMRAGFVEAIGASDFRLILEHTGNVLTLHVPFTTAPISVNVFAGCDHSLGGAGGCGPKFDNVPNFGGHPFVPKRNIFETGVL